MYIKGSLVSLFVFPLFLHAQIDSNQGMSVPIDANEGTSISTPLLSPSKPATSNRSRGFSIDKKDDEAEDQFATDKKKDFDMTTDNGLLSRKYDYTPSWLKKDKQFSDEFYSGQNFGTFNTNSKTIEVLCRDHQYVDGDKVALIHNGNVIIHQIYLKENFQSFIIDLVEGQNIIEFKALNQGTSGPNTAHFRVFDENGIMIVENEWNLATGVKATLMVQKSQ